MPKAGMSDPVHARDLFRIEPDLFMKRAAQRMQHRAFHGVAQGFRVNHQAAIVRAYEALYPDVTGTAVHLDLGDLGGNGLAAECISETTPRQDLTGCNRFW